MTYFFRYCGALIIIAATLNAFGQEEVFVINSKDLGIHMRPLVTFPHARHEENIDCGRCHHDFDSYGVNQDAEGRKCADCHNKTSPLSVSLTKAFHLQCKGCHQQHAKTTKQGLPVMCGQCHIRK